MTKTKVANTAERLKKILTPKDVARYWAKVDKTDTCWLWTGSLTPSGYGRIRVGGYNVPVHRIAYYLAYKNLEGEVIDHLCNVRNCVNPKHLKDTSQKENLLRANTVTGVNHRKTHCSKGHEFTVENTYVWVKADGTSYSRLCRECNRLRMLKDRQTIKLSKKLRKHILQEALSLIGDDLPLDTEPNTGQRIHNKVKQELRNKFNDKYKED